ncbi:hypothetical protein WDU94_000404 [Cyamophila willieti]
MAPSSTLLLVLASLCLAIAHAQGPDSTEVLLDNFKTDLTASIHDISAYFKAVSKVEDEIHYEEKLTELVNLVLQAKEVQEKKQKLKEDASSLWETFVKLVAEGDNKIQP